MEIIDAGLRRLKGKMAIVTGGGTSIGRSIAAKLSEHGANVVVNYVSSRQAAEDVVAVIKERDGSATPFKAGVAKAAEVETLVKRAIDEFGQSDILINNAGI